MPKRRRRPQKWLSKFDTFHRAVPSEPRNDPVLRVECDGINPFVSAPRRIVSETWGGDVDFMLVMLSGVYFAEYKLDGRTVNFEARAGDVVFWPAGMSRTEHNDPDDPMHVLCVTFRWPHAPRDLPRMVHDRRRLITNVAQAMQSVMDSFLPYRLAMLDAYAGTILGEYLRLADARHCELVEKVARYAIQHLRRRITLHELARHVGLETRYFGRRYKQLTGRTPMQDVARLRIEFAVGILHTRPELPLKAVAYHVGMANSHVLSRALRRHLKMTSRQIRA
jgi:AraC-like DNA-binding protein